MFNLDSARTRSLYILVLFFSVLSLTGCAGIIQTHVSPKGGMEGLSPKDCKSTYDETLCSGFTYSDKWISTYSRAGGNPSLFRDTIAAITLPAAAVAGFYGITGHGSPDRISRLSLGAATLYGAGTYFGGKNKQAVYFEGARAMACTQIAAFPALVNKANIETVKQHLAILQVELPKVAGLSDLSDTDAAIIADGKTMQQAALDYIEFVETAGLHLKARTNAIAIQVDRLLLDQEPDMNSLLSIASSIGQVAKSYQYNAPPKVAQGNEILAHSQESTELAGTIDALRTAAEAVRPLVSNLTARQSSIAQMNTCVPTAAASSFSVAPANASLSIVEGKSTELTITDSSGFPSVNLAGDAVEVDPLVVKGGGLVLVIRGKKVSGGTGTRVTIRSASGLQVHSVEVLVTKPAPSPPPDANTKPAPAVVNFSMPRSAAEKEFISDPQNVLRLQCALGLTGSDTDCVLGEKTRKAITAKRGDLSDEINESLISQAMTKEVLVGCEDPKLASCARE